jgi:hypothetical protein
MNESFGLIDLTGVETGAKHQVERSRVRIEVDHV